MKRMLFSLVLLMLLPVMAFAERVELVRAQKVAQTFLSNNGVKSAQLTDVAPSAGFTNLYIFNANPGFVVMAADDRVEPILGYSLEGQFVAEGMPDNVRWWLQGYEDGIQWSIDNDISASSETARQWQDLERGVKGPRTEVVVGPLIQTTWHQNAPFNNLCPGGSVTGCVATAMAQVMRYWSYPSRGIGSFEYHYDPYGAISADFGATDYDWDNMLYSYGSGSTQAQKTAVAKLMYHCGVVVEMKYGTSASGSNISKSAFGMATYFNYNTHYCQKKDYDESDWIEMLKADLDDSMPILYGGSGDPGGHAFVCDGYDSEDRFHFNWGWGSIGSAYYTIMEHSFPNDQAGVFRLFPKPCQAEMPQALTLTQQGCHVALTWDSANGAASYNIYRNDALIGNTNATEYHDTAAVFGENTYYVRSIDASGNLSLPSEYATATIEYQEPVVDDLSLEYSDGNATLQWSTPWWYPQTTTGIVTNVDEDQIYDASISWGDIGGYCLYWGSRYLSSELTAYQGQSIYKVRFYATVPAAYQVLVYQGTQTDEDGDRPVNLKTIQSITSARRGWIEVSFDEPVAIDSSEDLWVFVYNPDNKVRTIYCKDVESPGYGLYYSGDLATSRSFPDEQCHPIPYPIEWLIRTYLTDGVYTYNLYKNGTSLADGLAQTTYTDSDLPIGNYSYYVKTNYYAGEGAASNTVNLTIAEQSLSLDTGWNWWAPTLDVSLDALKQGLGTNGILINSQNSGFLRYEDGQWSGMLNALVPGQMYRIQTGNSCSFTMRGTPVTDVQVSIVPGYNWFGYTGTQSLPLGSLNISPAEGDKIISQNDGFAIYNGTSWEGTLGALQPGRGYVYLSTAQETKTMSF